MANFEWGCRIGNWVVDTPFMAPRILSFVLLVGMATFLLLVLAGTIDIGIMMDIPAGFTLGPLLLLHLVGNLIQVARKRTASYWWISLSAWAFIYLTIVLILVQAGNSGRPMWG